VIKAKIYTTYSSDSTSTDILTSKVEIKRDYKFFLFIHLFVKNIQENEALHFIQSAQRRQCLMNERMHACIYRCVYMDISMDVIE
jgi:hypothetical protein